jgi:hypothetical protein
MPIPLLILIALGCHRDAAIPARPPAGPSEPGWPVVARNLPGYLEIPLKQTPTGAFHVDVEIGPERLNMLLDTGADSVVLDRKIAVERLKFALKDSTILAGGLGTSQASTHTTPIPPLKIGPFTSVPGEALVMDLTHPNEAAARFGVPPIDGLLGSAFLHAHRAVIDYPHKRLFVLDLTKPGDAKK